MAKKKGLKRSLDGRPSIFEESLKIAVAREYIEGQYSYRQVADKYGLPSADTVRWFVKWYSQYVKDQPVTERNEDTGSSDEQALRLKITALEMLIQNAEKEFGIEIVKKSGTKQRGK